MGEGEDREITLSGGKLLGIFFALVAVCAVFFGLGYALGRGSSAATPINPEAVPQATPTSGAPKPSAVKPAETKPDVAPSNTGELTFYKSVEQKDANPELPAAGSAPAPAAPAPAELVKTAPGALVVQVAAVTKQEDADALQNALRRKQYPVFITSVETDKLFHVQVGPFTDIAEAESVKAKLTRDGYSPIVKK